MTLEAAPDTRCIVCGAEPGEACIVVDDPARGGPGAVRDEPHFYRDRVACTCKERLDTPMGQPQWPCAVHGYMGAVSGGS